ncbi:MAG: enoyl-CoA hydratase-related protein [Acidimicrobiia bacterium]|nr:enoyl-CoA hydratase-related protein [Acidimicrobiia bacterium]
MSNVILVDRPAPFIGRITLNRPEKRNAIDTAMRSALLAALQSADNDPEVRVSIIRGAGPCFSSGYDLSRGLMDDPPHHTAPGDGQWARHVTDSWLSLWDLAKPVIAQIHGYAIAGASELAAGCDLVYVAEDARIGHPVVRVMSPPDFNYHPWLVGFRNAMELMLTGDSVSGIDAVEMGFANRAYPADQLDDRVLEVAGKIAAISPDLAQLNKRVVHRAMEAMGVRTAIRASTELQALAGHQESVQAARANALEAIKGAVDRPDGADDDSG